MKRYDLAVIGSGPAGEKAAVQAAYQQRYGTDLRGALTSCVFPRPFRCTGSVSGFRPG